MSGNSTALIKYPGSKWKVSDWILSHYPPHKTYLEPFFGSGACFFNKKPSYIETINDIDGDIVNLFRVVREHPDELARMIQLTPYAREEYEMCKEPSSDPVEQARRTLVRYNQSFGTANAGRSTWKALTKAGAGRPETIWNYLPQAIRFCFTRLKNAQIESTDAINLIERYNHKDILIYT